MPSKDGYTSSASLCSAASPQGEAFFVSRFSFSEKCGKLILT